MLLRPRLITFDLLHTLITPRLPIHVQYAHAFKRFLALSTVDPQAVKQAFKTSLQELKLERPSYTGEKGTEGWWEEVIKRTVQGSCTVEDMRLENSLSPLTKHLMHRFSSREGYAVFDDVFPTLQRIKDSRILTAVVSNSDARMHPVMQSLGLASPSFPVVLSEEERIEKPNREIFLRALLRVNDLRGVDIKPEECLHIGDELSGDYYGARGADFDSLLLVRPDDEGRTHPPSLDDLDGVDTIRGLDEVSQRIS